MAQYKLTESTVTVDGRILYRIKAITNIHDPNGATIVHRGTQGGFVESEANLDQTGDCWIGPGVLVYEDAFVCGYSFVGGPGPIHIHGRALLQNAFSWLQEDICGDTVIHNDKQLSLTR